jgi:hypothetical protein
MNNDVERAHLQRAEIAMLSESTRAVVDLLVAIREVERIGSRLAEEVAKTRWNDPLVDQWAEALEALNDAADIHEAYERFRPEKWW